MSALMLHVFSEFDRVRVECDGQAVWIRSQNATVSLSLSRADRDALRRALDAADANAAGKAKTPEVALA